MYSHLFHQIDQKCIDVLGHEDKRYLNNAVSSANIYGLTYALISYFMATAIRRIQERNANNRDYKTSALIHVELDKKTMIGKVVLSIALLIPSRVPSWRKISQIKESGQL